MAVFCLPFINRRGFFDHSYFSLCWLIIYINNLNSLEGGVSMEAKQRQTSTAQARKSSIMSKQHFYFFISELRFFQFQSLIMTALLFLAWNLPLIRMLQIFISNNKKVTDTYLVSMSNFSRFIFTVEQYLVLDFIDPIYQNSNLSNLIFLANLVVYALYLVFLYLKFKRTLKIGKMELGLFRIWTFVIYFLSFYIYFITCTALIKGIRASSYKYLPVSIANIIGTFVVIFLIQFYFNQNQYLSKKSLSRLNNQGNTAVHMMKLILAGCVAFRDYFQNRNNFLCLYMVAYNVILVCEFKIILGNVVYNNEKTQALYQFFTLNTFVTYICITIYYLTGNMNVINNTMFVLITVDLLGLWALSCYKARRRQRLFQGVISENHDESELVWRMMEYVKLMRNQCNEKFSFSSLSIIKHLKECEDVTCFCSQYGQRNGAELINNRQFMQKFIISRLKAIKEQNNKSFFLKMTSINFKLIFLQSFTEIYMEFEKINLSSVSMNESLKNYIVYQFRRQFEAKIDEHARQSSQLRLRELFEEELFREKLIDDLEGVSSRNIKKYTLLSQDFCSLNKVYEIGNDITSLIKRIQQRWYDFKRMETYNMRILEIFLIYFEFLLPIRIQCSEVKSIINKRLHSFKFLKGVDEATINKAIYTHRAAVFQTTFKGYNDIRIANVSPHCSSVLLLAKKEIVGKEIHEIMPTYISLAHKELINQKLNKLDTVRHLDGIRDTFFVDHKGHCFAGKIHIKVSSIGNEVTFFVLLLKEDQNNYVVLDENLSIQGIGRRVEKEQIFYRNNIGNKLKTFCKEDIKGLFENKPIVKKYIQVSQLTQKIDTKSLIKCSNLDNISQNDLKDLFETVNYECQAQIARHYIKTTPYYTIKFGEVKKTFKVSQGKKNTDQLKKLSKRVGTMILNCQNQGQNQGQNPIKKIESMTILTEMEIENKSDIFAKGALLQGDNNLGINETSSTASSYKDNTSLSYTELMIKLKNYLINERETPRFHIPFMKLLMLIVGSVIVVCGFVQGYFINAGISSLADTYEAGNYVDNINQAMQIALNNEIVMHKYCTSGNSTYATRCAYLNNTQTFLNKELYSKLLASFSGFLSKKTDMFGVRYYQGLDLVVEMSLNGSVVAIPEREFFEIYYYSLRKVQSADLASPEAANNVQFLKDNWNLVMQINDRSLAYYRERANYEQESLISIIYSYNGLYFAILVVFTLPFHLFLGRCEGKKETVVRLFQMIDIESSKRLMDNEKTIAPMITDGVIDRNAIGTDVSQKHHSKRYSQFIYHKAHHHKFCILFIFLILLALNLTTAATILQYLPANQVMAANLQSLLSAQNQAVQDYITLKMQLFTNSPISRTTQMSSSVEYVERLKSIFTSFVPADDMISDRLIELVLNDTCWLNRNYLPSSQQKRCKDSIIDLMSKGIAATVQSLVRQTESYSIKFSQNPASPEDYLTNPDFVSLDDQLVFNMRIFQLIKAQIISSFDRTLSNFNGTIRIFNYLQLAVVAVAVYAAMTALGNKQVLLRNLFGIVLQVPQKVFTESKLVMRIVSDTLLENCNT